MKKIKIKLIVLTSMLIGSLMLLSALYIVMSKNDPFGFILSEPYDDKKDTTIINITNDPVSNKQPIYDQVMYSEDLDMLKKHILNNHWELLRDLALDRYEKYNLEGGSFVLFAALTELTINKNQPQNLVDIVPKITDPELYVLLFTRLSSDEQTGLIYYTGIKKLPQFKFDDVACTESDEPYATHLITLTYNNYPYYVYVNKQNNIEITKIEDKNQRLVDIYK